MLKSINITMWKYAKEILFEGHTVDFLHELKS